MRRMNHPSTPLPSFEEAAQQAYAKAKEAGAGKFPPGSPKDAQRTVDAATGHGQLSEQRPTPIPPVVRSVLSLSGQSAMLSSRALGRAAPGFVGGLLYQGRSFSFAAGFRDGMRGFDNEDKGNHLRLRDPLGLHTLTIPVTGLLAWRLHKAGTIDLFRPITEYLPELPQQFDAFPCRDVLGHRMGLSDSGVFKSLGASSVGSTWSPSFVRNFHSAVWKPVDDALPGNSASESRTALLQHIVKSHEKIPRVRRLTSLRGHVSHSAIALLALAMERASNDSFENLMENHVFRVVETPSAGFGPPKLVNRSHIFYQPGGLPAGHWSTKEALPPEDGRNAAPRVFNGSLNLFANPEEFAKLAIVFFEAVTNATKEFTPPSNSAPYYELGVCYQPVKKIYSIRSDWRMGDGVTAFSGAAEYHLDKDVGAFAVSNCGNRRSRAVNNLSATITARLFIKQVVDTGMNIWDGVDGAPVGEGPDQRVNLAAQDAEQADKLFNRKSIGRLVGGVDKYTRF